MADETVEREPYPTQADVDAVLAEFDGDARAALQALLSDLDALAQGYVERVSFGYVRGEPTKVRRPRK